MRFQLREFIVAFGVLWLLAAALACGQDGPAGIPEEKPMKEKAIDEVLKEHTDSLMSLPGVVGTGEGECGGRPCIKVFVGEKTSALLSQIPSAIEGYPVEVQQTGEIHALDPE